MMIMAAGLENEGGSWMISVDDVDDVDGVDDVDDVWRQRVRMGEGGG